MRRSFLGLALGLVIAVPVVLAAGCGLFGPSAVTPEAAEPDCERLPLPQADGLWQEVVATAKGVSPILQPGYLPPGLDGVQVLDLWFGGFRVEYFGEHCRLMVSAGPRSLPMWGEGAKCVEVAVHGQKAYLTDDPQHGLFITWFERGRYVGDEATPERAGDKVFYVVSATGLDLEEVLRCVEELGPG